MDHHDTQYVTFARWLRQPQTLIALSAVLLSLCGLFIALYEASIIRQAQRASVWPHVSISVSLASQKINLWVQNNGVGPAIVLGALTVLLSPVHWIALR